MIVPILLTFYIQKNKLAARLSFQDEIDVQTLTNDYDPSQQTAIFNNIKIEIPQAKLQEEPQISKILGESNQDKPKKILIDLAKQRLMAFEGDDLKYYFIISSGKWGRTPTGTFKIWSKFRYTKMSGGSTALRTYYYLPNVPYVMFFYNNQVSMSRGFSLHGTYWHENFGHPMSHGCVNMITQDVEKLFYWAEQATKNNPGTEIIIYGETPAS